MCVEALSKIHIKVLGRGTRKNDLTCESGSLIGAVIGFCLDTTKLK